MSLGSFLRELYDREIPPDIRVWHKWHPFIPVRTIEGHWSFLDPLWRRWNGQRWEYSERPETFEEWADRQW